MLALYIDALSIFSESHSNYKSLDELIEEYTNYHNQKYVIEKSFKEYMYNNFVEDICNILANIFKKNRELGVVSEQMYIRSFYDYYEINTNGTMATFWQKYQIGKTKLQGFLKKYPYMLENYLIHNIFETAFPLRVEESLYYNYALYLIYYRILDLGLVMVAGIKGDCLNENDIINFITLISKQMDHSAVYYDVVDKYIRRNEDFFSFVNDWLVE